MSKKVVADVKKDIKNHEEILINLINRVAAIENKGSMTLGGTRINIPDTWIDKNGGEVWSSTQTITAPSTGSLSVFCCPYIQVYGTKAYAYDFDIYVKRGVTLGSSKTQAQRDEGRDGSEAFVSPASCIIPSLSVNGGDTIEIQVRIYSYFGKDKGVGKVDLAWFWH